jgi:glycosyltransferase involved in cell wall biosynthesis
MLVVVSCFWNCENYIEKCINSVKNQKMSSFKMYLIDDLSTDNTVSKIKNLIVGDERFFLIENTEKKYKLKNMDYLLMNDSLINDEDIIVELDGDDWFYDENTLTTIMEKYNNNKNLWLTNGSFVYSTGHFGFSSKVNYKTVRSDEFRFSHLRTWKAHLWRKIEEESFLDENGEYFKSAPDVAYSLPMIEMSGDLHYEYLPNILLVYNAESPYNEHKPESAGGGLSEQSKNANTIRKKKQYKKIL